MICADEAKYILKSNCFAEIIKVVPLLSAPGYVLASNLYAKCDVPAFDNAAMDGYALKFVPGKNSYKVTAIVAAGDKPVSPSEVDEAVRIFTGAPLPEYTDTVVPQEICIRTGNTITISQPEFRYGTNIRKKGTQNYKGQLILEKGAKITEPMIAYIASAGITHLEIYSPPSVAVIVTGSEIVNKNEAKNEFKIYDANGPALLASLNALKVNKAELFHVADNQEALKKIACEALAKYDMLIFTGGISVGDYDYVRPVLEEEGVVRLIYKVAQKPGKPFFAGKKEDKWVFALPGNPGAVLTCFAQYVKPVIQMMSGYAGAFNDFIEMPLLSSYKKKSGLTFFLKARTEGNKVRILNGQDSFDLSAFAKANAYVELPPEKEDWQAEDMVKVYII
jgi:molybdopterin molybdotransferase